MTLFEPEKKKMGILNCLMGTDHSKRNVINCGPKIIFRDIFKNDFIAATVGKGGDSSHKADRNCKHGERHGSK